jgi:hypothetical protein
MRKGATARAVTPWFSGGRGSAGHHLAGLSPSGPFPGEDDPPLLHLDEYEASELDRIPRDEADDRQEEQVPFLA